MVFAGLGGLLFLVGMIWLIIIAVQTGQSTGEKAIWGLVNFFCQPLGGIIFYFMKRQGLVPLILMLVGWALCVFGGGYGAINEMMRGGFVPTR